MKYILLVVVIVVGIGAKWLFDFEMERRSVQPPKIVDACVDLRILMEWHYGLKPDNTYGYVYGPVNRCFRYEKQCRPAGPKYDGPITCELLYKDQSQ